MNEGFVWTEGRIRNLLALIADKDNVMKAIADAGFTVEELCEMGEPAFSDAVDKVLEIYFNGKGQFWKDKITEEVIEDVCKNVHNMGFGEENL